MVRIKAVTADDTGLWCSVDGNITAEKLKKRIADNTGFIIYSDNKAVGVITYNMLWDELPFLSLIKILPEYQRRGYGRQALRLFESYLKDSGFLSLLTSTQTDEKAQFFYRKAGYKECGCLIFDGTKIKQPMEMFFIKDL